MNLEGDYAGCGEDLGLEPQPPRVWKEMMSAVERTWAQTRQNLQTKQGGYIKGGTEKKEVTAEPTRKPHLW